MVKMNSLKHILFLFSLLIFSSCDHNRVYEENKEISDMVWNADEKISFEVDVTDTIYGNNFYVNIRNADNYGYSNIYLFVNTKFPDGKIAKDTLECILADENGKWLGSGAGDIWDNRILFKKNVRFPMKGKYIFTYEQAMRVADLPMIMDVGLRIEKSSAE